MQPQSKCRACGSIAKYLHGGEVLDIKIDYFECSNCGYVQTEKPYWLERAYRSAINDSDTGIMLRNTANVQIILSTLLAMHEIDGKVVDCAGGYGILVRLLRDCGIDAFWSDPYCANLVAKGFDYKGGAAQLVTVFEAFEHFVDPGDEMDALLRIAPNILLSTEIVASPAPAQSAWWYYGREHGQHIGFFRISTLEKLARDRGKFFTTNGVSHHLITERPINERLWKILLRMKQLVPLVLKFKLTSKIWPDHLLMANRDE
jgi:Methyltransferase domain